MRTRVKTNVLVVGGSNTQLPVTQGQVEECMTVGRVLGRNRVNVVVPIQPHHNLAHMVANMATFHSGLAPRLVDPALSGAGVWETYRDDMKGLIWYGYVRPSYVNDDGYLCRIIAEEDIRALVLMGDGGAPEMLALIQALSKGILVIACGSGLASNTPCVVNMLPGIPTPNVLYRYAEPLHYKEVRGAIYKARKEARRRVREFELELSKELLASASKPAANS